MTQTLNIIGCGQVGKVLGRLWATAGTFEVQDILNRSLESAARAADFIGAGRAHADPTSMRAADVYMIGTADDQIAQACETLADMGLLSPDAIVFHCSGALPSGILAAAKTQGASVASVHPIRSFAGAEQAAASFAGTYCGVEGDAVAVEVLTKAFSSIGAKLVPVDAELKSVYHAAAVFSSNYLVTLMDVALEAYVKAGVPRDDALKLMEPLVRGTVDNIFRLGPTEALTGPIARGDVATVLRQYRAVSAWDKRFASLYKQLGKQTAAIAARRRSAGQHD
ncbi:MAG TPA: Rossmann-like and DUF2520 domain-containing protein [Noviherbaspirillum sp.]|nr:Rossmann-like and DUF2520 domain-containing protein [Noviherbaspirillum sp.]